mgnify:CR=1 FL=1
MALRELITVGDKEYRLTVLRVTSRRADGRPENVTVIEANDTAELSRDVAQNCFITAYLPIASYRKFAGQIPTIPDE